MNHRLLDSLPEIAEQIGRAPHVLICLDFDGTLAPFRLDPGLPTLSPQVERTLWGLSEQAAVSLAIISGRERADLQNRIAIPRIIYAGNHGLEISGNGWLFVEPTAAAHCDTLKKLAADLTRQLQPIEGALVEFKGLTLSVHFRQVKSADLDEVRRIVHSILAKMDQLFHLTAGAMVHEIRPRVPWNKGSAVGWIKDQLNYPDTLVIYLGDDVTDEDAFAALRDQITVKVGNSSDTAAQYRAEGPAEVRTFLEWLEDLFRRQTLRAEVGTSAQADWQTVSN